MTADPADERPAQTRWIHVFEEDTSEGAVYRPDDTDVPLSRRPRERLVLEPNGRATLLTGGPDDRLAARQVRWHGSSDGPRDQDGDVHVHVVSRAADRLVVRITGPSEPL